MPTAEKCLTKALRTTLVVLFILQLLSTVERQIFDFLGYMWAPIIGNFFQIIVVILGIFGACNFYRSCIVVYATWNLLWLGWNIFVICLYLEVGILNRNQGRYILTIGTESKSWWLEHGIGCEVTNSSWEEEEVEVDAGRKIPPESLVVGCILQYYYVEVIHAAIQCLLSLGGFVASCICIYCYIEEDDPSKYSLNQACYSNQDRSHLYGHYHLDSSLLLSPRCHLYHSHLPSLPNIAFPYSPVATKCVAFHPRHRGLGVSYCPGHDRLSGSPFDRSARAAGRPRLASYQYEAVMSTFAAKRPPRPSCFTDSRYFQSEPMLVDETLKDVRDNCRRPSNRVVMTALDYESDDDVFVVQTEL